MMKIIVVGVGKVGETLTRFLSEEGHDVVIVDNDPMALQTVVDRYDVRGVVGNGASYEVLVEAGAQHSELLIATTDRDEVNILSCLVAKRHGVAYTIARVRNPEYSNQRSFYRDELGINLIVNPELETAREMIRLLTYPSASKIEPFADGRLDLVEVQVQEDSPLVGVALKELESKLNIQILVCAVERNGEAIIPDGNFVIQAEDIIHYTAIQEDLVKSFKRLKILKKPVKNVLIIGGSNIAYYLARMLERRHIGVKIIEVDEKRAKELSEQLPHVTVICGEGSNHELLYEEGIEQTDAVITLSGIDEENIILSLFAAQLGVPKVITKLNRYHDSRLIRTLPLDSVLCPKEICANEIVRYVRSLEDAREYEMLTLYKLINQQVEAAEFYIHEASDITGITLHDLRLKEGVLIASIMRGNRWIIPKGSDWLEPHDRVVIVSKSQTVLKLEDVLKR